MAQDPSAHDAKVIARQRNIIALGAAHADLLRAYFGLQAYGGLFAGALLALSPITGQSIPVYGRPWVTLPLLALNTWAAFRTRQLLSEGEPDGVVMAAVVFGWDLLVAIGTGHPGKGAVFTGIGLLLTLSIWRGLRASAALVPTARPNER